MTVTPINSLDEFRQLINSGRVIAIDFWATWCGPCRSISPRFERFSEELPGIGFYKVDVDEQGAIAQEVGVRAMPTFVVFQNGNKVDDLVGADPPKLQMLLANAQSLL
ncbi:thioredoxin [Lactifluus subvellereus]|nr:thioredoxin [Lactifluus subvellereus]